MKEHREAKKRERESSFFRDTKIEKKRERKRERERERERRGLFFVFFCTRATFF